MEMLMNSVETTDLNDLKNLQNVEGDLEIARRVVENNEPAVFYFLSDFSIPFLDYIGREIVKSDGIVIDNVRCYYPDLMSRYFEFIGAQFVECQLPFLRTGLN